MKRRKLKMKEIKAYIRKEQAETVNKVYDKLRL